MSKTSTTIEINGKRYDALSGALLNVDGIHKSGDTAKAVAAGTALAPVKPLAAPVALTKKPTMSDVVRPSSQPVHGKAPQRSHTLMRHTVRKPKPSLKRQTKAVHPLAAIANVPKHTAMAKVSVAKVDEHRLEHALKAPKSPSITRHAKQTVHHNPEVLTAARASSPAPIFQPPAQPTPARERTTADLLEEAIKNASGHKQAPHPRPTPLAKRLSAIGLASVAAILLIAVVISQNMTDLKLQLASSKAGFAAALPAYKPSGYSFGEVASAAGSVAVHYKSNSDARAYTVIQKPSSWDSQALKEQFVVKTSPNYQTVQSGGRIIYLYGDKQATWTSGGIWYIIQSNGSLSDRQLIDLASSL